MPVALQDFSGFYESYLMNWIPCPDKSITLIIISDTKNFTGLTSESSLFRGEILKDFRFNLKRSLVRE
jgi:hypothetical protein